ncbi:MAG: ATP synthase F1 subunit delta [Bacteroidota bacterium]
MNPVARRYAQALYQEAEALEASAAGSVEKIDADVRDLRTSLADSRDLLLLFESPVIPNDKKTSVVEKLLKGNVQPLTLDFVKLLVQKDRDGLLPEVLDAYQALRDEVNGVVEADVRSAMPLSAKETKALTKTLQQRTGKKVRLQVRVDEALMGGIVVRIGDQVYDGSVRHQLAQLRDQFAQRAYVSMN